MPARPHPHFLLFLAVACGGYADVHELPHPAAQPQHADVRQEERPPAPDPSPPSAREFREGRDYQLLERVRLVDAQGFGQPVEAASFLLPRGWKLEGGVQWRVGHPCMNEAVAVRYTASSPDGSMRLDGFPVRSWQWNDDPSMLQALQNQQQGYARSCDVLPPYDAAEFVQRLFLSELGGPKVLSMERAEDLARAMEAEARRNHAALLAQGLGNLSFRPSAVKARLAWPDGSRGLLLCSVDQTVMAMQNFMTGGVMQSFQCQSNFRALLRHPAGQEDAAERVLATAIASARVNPHWQQAVAQVFSAVAQVERQEAAKRAAIWRETSDSIQASQRRSWEESQASQDRIHVQWGRAIRGVDEWRDPFGGTVELSAGYQQAWSRADGTWLLSNDPLFDPRIVLQEDWRAMERR